MLLFDDIQEQKIRRTKSAVRCICLSDRMFSISFFACKYAYSYLFVCMLDIWRIIFILKILFDHKQILDCHSSEIKTENIPQNYIEQASLHFLKYLNIYFLSIFPDQPVYFLRNFYRFSE